MSGEPAPLAEAERKAVEARELIAKGSFDAAIELLATALELRCATTTPQPAVIDRTQLCLTSAPPG